MVDFEIIKDLEDVIAKLPADKRDTAFDLCRKGRRWGWSPKQVGFAKYLTKLGRGEETGVQREAVGVGSLDAVVACSTRPRSI